MVAGRGEGRACEKKEGRRLELNAMGRLEDEDEDDTEKEEEEEEQKGTGHAYARPCGR